MTTVIWTPQGKIYTRVPYASEADLEDAILQVQDTLFGEHRIYLDVKKKIGRFGQRKNIPDGYLLDLSGHHPRLYVVENELASHDPYDHIVAQIGRFSASFKSDKPTVKQVLLDALNKNPSAKKLCRQYAAAREFRNIDHLLEAMIYDAPFTVLIIIDELSQELRSALRETLQAQVSWLTLARFESDTGEQVYQFTPFHSEVTSTRGKAKAPERFDTIVVPAQKVGFQETFLGENRWYAIRIGHSKQQQKQIRYIAAYRTAPISAVTHIAKVAAIEPWGDTGKYIVYFDGPAKEITPPIKFKGGLGKVPQGPRYTTYERLMSAETLDDLW